MSGFATFLMLSSLERYLMCQLMVVWNSKIISFQQNEEIF